MAVVVVDNGGHVVSAQRQDGATMFRIDVARGKAWAAAERIHNVGPMTEGAGSPAQLGDFLAGEHRRWAQITQEIGALPE